MPDRMEQYDRIIIGAGLYGLYAALQCGRGAKSVLVLEFEDGPFRRATYINQARIHMGYHYPRSLTTACRSAGYYRRFHEDFSFARMTALSRSMHMSAAVLMDRCCEEFRNFCQSSRDPVRERSCRRPVFPTGHVRRRVPDGRRYL
jgi:glycine/D-amino acid oxidase-like deaminating enzyme